MRHECPVASGDRDPCARELADIGTIDRREASPPRSSGPFRCSLAVALARVRNDAEVGARAGLRKPWHHTRRREDARSARPAARRPLSSSRRPRAGWPTNFDADVRRPCRAVSCRKISCSFRDAPRPPTPLDQCSPRPGVEQAAVATRCPTCAVRGHASRGLRGNVASALSTRWSARHETIRSAS